MSLAVRRALTAMSLASLPALTGCANDNASYMVEGDRMHAITIKRTQTWPWSRHLTLSVIVSRGRDCQGRAEVDGIDRDQALGLHRAPADYPEPIFILTANNRHFAISTASCRIQEFSSPPADTGTRLGEFSSGGEGFRFRDAAP